MSRAWGIKHRIQEFMYKNAHAKEHVASLSDGLLDDRQAAQMYMYDVDSIEVIFNPFSEASEPVPFLLADIKGHTYAGFPNSRQRMLDAHFQRMGLVSERAAYKVYETLQRALTAAVGIDVSIWYIYVAFPNLVDHMECMRTEDFEGAKFAVVNGLADAIEPRDVFLYPNQADFWATLYKRRQRAEVQLRDIAR